MAWFYQPVRRLSETFASSTPSLGREFNSRPNDGVEDAKVFLLEDIVDAFWVSLGIVFLAELGDKTQLVALSLATRFNARVVLLGVFVATLCVHLISVGLGGAAGKLLPIDWIRFIAGLAFVGFGLWTLRGDELCEGDDCRKARSPFWVVTITFFLAELGDKTMLSTVTLATERSLLWVWLGSSLGMVISDALAIVVGQVMGARLPERLVKTIAACIFFAFGAYSMVQGGAHLPAAVWFAGAVAIIVSMRLMFRPIAKRLKEGAHSALNPVRGSHQDKQADPGNDS